MAKVDDYKFTGYGIISTGSSVKMFMGTDQQFFLGGKNNMMVGLSNAFTFGSKSDVMVGPSISMGLLPFAKWITAGTIQRGHFVAKYDFSTNKNFAFQIAPEGSSNYVSKSKFNCEEQFQAVAGYQVVGENLYDAYKATLTKMGTLVALSNLVSSLAVFANTLEAPAPPADGKGDLKGDTTRQALAGAAAFAANAASTAAVTYAAISAAIQRETSFKTWIHPQSVIDLKPEHVFLGAAGNVSTSPTNSGASLLIENGRATLGARTFLPKPPPIVRPYKKDFNDFLDKPTTWLGIDPTTIDCTAQNVIKIEAGVPQSLAPAKKGAEVAKRALALLQDAKKIASQQAYNLTMLNPANLGPNELNAAIKKAKVAAVAPIEVSIAAAIQAVNTAENFYKTNPSLFLSAGSIKKTPLSVIEAKAPNFNVIANSISLSDTDVPVRGLFIKQTPPVIQLVQTPRTSEIRMAASGTTLTFGASVIELKPLEIVIKNGAGSISVKPLLITIGAGPQQVKIGGGIVQVGGALKVIG